MPETMQLTFGFDNTPTQLLVRLGDVDLPRRFVVACARKREFYVGDLIQMSQWQVRERCGRSEADLASVEKFMTRFGFEFETTIERWTSDGAAMMEGLVFGIARPSPKILAIPMERLGLGTRAMNCCRRETVGQLAGMTVTEFLRTPGAWHDTLHEIREALAHVGAAFRGEVAVVSRIDQALVRRLTEGTTPSEPDEDPPERTYRP
ncbi:hypothetical protein ACVIGB_001019 [Bradyrhizobium sp. USDA 4341]